MKYSQSLGPDVFVLCPRWSLLPVLSLTFFSVLKLHSVCQSLNTSLDMHSFSFPQGLPFKGSLQLWNICSFKTLWRTKLTCLRLEVKLYLWPSRRVQRTQTNTLGVIGEIGSSLVFLSVLAHLTLSSPWVFPWKSRHEHSSLSVLAFIQEQVVLYLNLSKPLLT